MGKGKVLVTTPLLLQRRADWDDGHEIVTPAGIAAGMVAAESIEVIVTGESLDDALVAQLPRLRLVACFSTGYGGIDVARLRERGIALTTGGGVRVTNRTRASRVHRT